MYICKLMHRKVLLLKNKSQALIYTKLHRKLCTYEDWEHNEVYANIEKGKKFNVIHSSFDLKY